MSQTDYSKASIIDRLSEVEGSTTDGADNIESLQSDVADLQVALLYASLTAGAEAANARAVTIQAKDATGADVAAAVKFHCQIFDINMLAAVVGSWRLAETGAGTEVTTTAKPSLIIQTDANGAATVTVTDVGGASNTTVYLKVSPINSYGRDSYIALVFDNA